MATVEVTVRTALTCFPSLFDSRTAVLHHILCVLGSGYSWVDGEAVHDYPQDDIAWTAERERERRTKSLADMFERMRDFEGSQGLIKKITADLEVSIDKHQQIVNTVEERVQLRKDLKAVYPDREGVGMLAIYPQYPEAMLLNTPADLTPDWAEAVAEMRTYARRHGWDLQMDAASI